MDYIVRNNCTTKTQLINMEIVKAQQYVFNFKHSSFNVLVNWYVSVMHRDNLLLENLCF
jgi:hypothetical protein